MPNYRRTPSRGNTIYFTVVSYRRRPLFLHEDFRLALRESVAAARLLTPFMIDAWVLLPEHMHCIWTLPEDGGYDYPEIWAAIKRSVSKRCGQISSPGSLSASRVRRQERGIWQRRFWEHKIHHERDYRNHLDYTYWNPVKHGLVTRVQDWPYSTFHRDVRVGIYPLNWGEAEEPGMADIAAGE